MIYIQIPEKHDALGFLALAKSGIPISCLPNNSYGVSNEHLKLLRRKRTPFKKLITKKRSREGGKRSKEAPLHCDPSAPPLVST
jgi:hypothetical protein